MLDFPASPSTGQIFQNWQWDSVKWRQLGSVVPMPVTDTGRNLVTNGTFVVAQRGAGPWTANNSYTADRWALYLNTDAASISVSTYRNGGIGGTTDLTSYLSANVTGSATAGAYSQIAQRIEGVARLSGKTVTVSVLANVNAGTPKLAIGLIQNFGTGGSPTAPVTVPTQYITLSTTNARQSVTFNVPSTTGATMGTNGNDYTQLALTFSSQADAAQGVQTAIFNIAAVQLEIGSVATALDAGGSPQQILAECQRFYVNYIGAQVSGWGGGSIWGTITLPVTMRAAPTCAIVSPGYGNASALGISQTSVSAVVLVATAGTGTAWASGILTASADL